MARRDDKKFDANAIVLPCELCGSVYQFGPHIYDGKTISIYKLSVCMSCFKVNWDGWGPIREVAFVNHLKENSLPLPHRNKSSWYPRGQ